MTVRGIYGLSKIEEIDVYGRYRGTAKLGYLDSVHMKAYLSDSALSDLDADLVCVGLFEGEELSEPLGSTAGAKDASGEFKSTASSRPS
jgi:hypothetical protein